MPVGGRGWGLRRRICLKTTKGKGRGGKDVRVDEGEGMGWVVLGLVIDSTYSSPNGKTEDTLAVARDVILLHCIYLLSLFLFPSFLLFLFIFVAYSFFHCYYLSLSRAVYAYRMLC